MDRQESRGESTAFCSCARGNNSHRTSAERAPFHTAKDLSWRPLGMREALAPPPGALEQEKSPPKRDVIVVQKF